MFPQNCSAVLKTVNNKLIEYGNVSVSVKNHYADFKNSFVPLMKVGTNVKVVCLESGQETHIITGTVYLSSKHLLRIVSIACHLMPQAETVLSINTEIKAQILIESERKQSRFSLKHLTLPVLRWDECKICLISAQRISFYSEQIELDLHSLFTIKIGEPIFKTPFEFAVKPEKNSLLFGKTARYDCKIIKIQPYAIPELTGFIRKTNMKILSGIVDTINDENKLPLLLSEI